MKATFIGGGAHRLLKVLRATLGRPEILGEDGEIYLHDLDLSRAEAMGRILRQTPEYRHHPVAIRWGSDLDKALEGAAVVSVILMAGSQSRYFEGNAACLEHGFLGSDNLSPGGSFLAMKGAPILKAIAERMERLCPEAWLVDFANPVAVLSGMINRHTPIRCLGVCAGFLNYQWDLARLFGRDEQSNQFRVSAAGVNHLSFVMDGTYRGRDLFAQLDERLGASWTPPPLPGKPPKVAEAMRRGLERLVELYREYRFMIFSTELDGMAHFFYDEEVRAKPRYTTIRLAELMKEGSRARREENARFAARAGEELDDAFWAQPRSFDDPFAPAEDDIFLRVLTGVSRVEPVEIVASRLNQGAIEGFADDTVVEYSQRLHGLEVRPAGRYRLPPVAHGFVHALAWHQTLLGDACFHEDPRLLADALKAYPVKAFTPESRALYRDLFALHCEEIPAPLREAARYFN